MEVHEAIRTRRSIRKFQSKEVLPEDIIELINAARHAPSAGNLQSWKFILVKDQKKKNDIADACYQQNWISQAPVIIVVCAIIEELKRNYGTRGEMLYSIQNAAVAMQNIALRAHEMGLGTTIVSAFDEGMIKRICLLTDVVRPQAVIPVGYPDEVPPPKLIHSLESMTYFEEYGKRVEDWNEAFYEWGGMTRARVEKLARKSSAELKSLKEKIHEKLKK